MIESLYLENLASEPNFARRPAGSGNADSRERQPFELLRNLRPAANAKQQLILFAAVQCLLGCCAGKPGWLDDIGGNAGREANALQIE